jgi:hypothetical protein
MGAVFRGESAKLALIALLTAIPFTASAYEERSRFRDPILGPEREGRPSECFLSLERPQPDRARWESACGGRQGEHGTAINRLDAIRRCDRRDSPCLPPPGIAVPLSAGPYPLELPTTLPACYPAGPREWAPIGFVDFHRSCFRALSTRDRGRLRSWSRRPVSGGEACQLDKFGDLATDPRTGGLARTPEHVPWADRFLDEYPVQGSAAEAIYEAFRRARDTSQRCLSQLNPNLNSRVRQAMGIEPRGTQPPESYRPAIDCRDQDAYFCPVPRDECERLRIQLSDGYEEGRLGESGRAALAQRECRPAHPPGQTLGSIDGANLRQDDVAKGSPRIHIFNATALYDSTAHGASTVLHEFLHAAGAHDGRDHNHGTRDNEVPPGDQVYACQAIVFSAFFDGIPGADLKRACLTCASPEKAHLCSDRDSDLQRLGCRVR